MGRVWEFSDGRQFWRLSPEEVRFTTAYFLWLKEPEKRKKHAPSARLGFRAMQTAHDVEADAPSEPKDGS